MTALTPGDRVVFVEDEPELNPPLGRRVPVTTVHHDVGGGIDIRTHDGRHFNTMPSALDPDTTDDSPMAYSRGLEQQ
ncbi:hypothetical protein OG705_29025 [Streptomyces sp. NBC_00838]|uniref:hypothetical protein n=1 Tax=Streptomyces sp. NBC_00838 TaxID=2903680 RepID=UPI0038678CFF|nr:hypothetical protein OG705_29025 [Streptomyces sp. NBC_00838]